MPSLCHQLFFIKRISVLCGCHAFQHSEDPHKVFFIFKSAHGGDAFYAVGCTWGGAQEIFGCINAIVIQQTFYGISGMFFQQG